MELGHAVAIAAFLAALAVAASLIPWIAYVGSRPGPAGLEELACDVCALAANPGASLVKAYRLPPIRVLDGAIVLEEPRWLRAPCGRQEGSELYLPIAARGELELAGTVLLNLTSSSEIVWVEIARPQSP